MHVETLVTATSREPLIRTVVASPRVYYGTIPLDRAGGTVDYQAGVVSFSGFHTGFGALQSTLAGQVTVDVPIGELTGFVHVAGPASALPYAQTIAAGEAIRADAILGGNGRDGFRARGTIDSDGAHGSGQGFLAIDSTVPVKSDRSCSRGTTARSWPARFAWSDRFRPAPAGRSRSTIASRCRRTPGCCRE